MKKNVLLLSLLSLLGLVTSCYDDSELRERIEKLENTTIPSINEQISSIRSSITELQNVDNAIKNSITELQNADAGLRQNIADLQKADEGLGTEIENLKDVDAQHQRSIDLLTEQEDALSTQIANLQTYVDSSLVSQKEWAQNSLTNQAEWVSATFTTLEQYASVVGNVATLQVTLDSLQAKLQADLQAMDEQNAALFAGVNERIDSLAKALTQTESSLKTWVGEQFANYYDIAAVDARLAVINDSIVKGDERLATEVASVRTALSEAQKELTTAYQKAIRTAIEDYNGTITKQIASDIATVNGHIDDEVKRLDDRIDAVEKRVSELEGKVEELLKTLDITFDVEGSVAYSPGTTVNVNYTLTNADATTVVECLADAGWKANVKQTSSTKGSISVETPLSGGEGKVLVFVNKGDRTVMKVLRFEQGILQVLTDVVAVEPGDTLFTIETRTNVDFRVVIPAEAQPWIELLGVDTRATMRTDVITLKIKSNVSNQSRSAVITIVDSQSKELSSFTIFQRADVQANNEIWYTSTDGNIVEPSNPRGFGGVNIVSNTYAKGKGVIIFDGDVKTVGNGAFVGNNGYNTISLPEGLTSIGEGVFGSCSNLTFVTIPNSVSSIGDYAFQNCASLTSVIIPNSVTSIGQNAFSGCSSLTSVSIPDAVTNIGSQTFSACSNLASVTIGNSVTSIGEAAFYGCSSLASITLPSSVTSIGRAAFYECSGLTFITIPESVTSIGESALSGCSSLPSVIIPKSVRTLSDGLFYGCNNLVSIIFSESITSIGSGVFYDCSSLTSFIIPATVTSIGADAFNGCFGLSSIFSLSSIPPYAESYGIDAFSGDVINYCSLYVPKGCVAAYSADEKWKNFKDIKELNSVKFSEAGGTSNPFSFDGEFDIQVNAEWLGINRQNGEFTVTATENNSNKFRSTYLSIMQDGKMAFIVVVTQDAATTGLENGHDYVDLGLPSGTLWATCNVGAKNPEDNGEYFAFGETISKTEYSWSTYKYSNESGNIFTKYYEYYGGNLDLEDDAAHVTWGGRWRMASNDEWKELINNCTSEWTSRDGHRGRVFVSNINGNSIFLSTTGNKTGTNIDGEGFFGEYWSSTNEGGRPYAGWAMEISSYGASLNFYDNNYKYKGMNIRPVFRP